MFDIEHFNHLNYIKKEPLSGSKDGMRYLFMKKKEGDDTYMLGVIWPEPYGYAKTPQEQKIEKRFTLDHDGLVDAVAWLNEHCHEYIRYKGLKW